ncbi:unnamed protein product [Auanema sp. JU1783]|nr:unnamed protein product [Auanema sp. JU1783]
MAYRKKYLIKLFKSAVITFTRRRLCLEKKRRLENPYWRFLMEHEEIAVKPKRKPRNKPHTFKKAVKRAILEYKLNAKAGDPWDIFFYKVYTYND